jgi:hypothetical protein
MNIRLHFYASYFGTGQQTKLKMDFSYSSMRSNRQFGWLLALENNRANKKTTLLSADLRVLLLTKNFEALGHKPVRQTLLAGMSENNRQKVKKDSTAGEQVTLVPVNGGLIEGG